jgi:carboxypeptidase Q
MVPHEELGTTNSMRFAEPPLRISVEAESGPAPLLPFLPLLRPGPVHNGWAMKHEAAHLTVPPRPRSINGPLSVMRLGLALTLALLWAATTPDASPQTPPPDQTNAVALPETTTDTRLAAVAPPAQSETNDAVARIRDEGLNHSQVMATLSYLCDVIGPRLTGSPNLKRANEWTRDQLVSWGLTNAHLEAWGPFGRGWSLRRFSAQVVKPQAIPLIAYPSAWSPGLDGPITADVVYFDARTDADLEKFSGKLKGAIVLASPVRDVRTHFEPLASRLAETNLLRMANAAPPRAAGAPQRGGGPGRRGGSPAAPSALQGTNAAAAAPALGPRGGPVAGRGAGPGRFLSFFAREGVAAVLNPSSQGDLGTVFVSAASVPPPAGRGAAGARPSIYSTNAPSVPPQITVAVEDYNRLVRMIQQGEKLKMSVELQVQFHDDDLMAYNTIADMPGSDLSDEIVMLGGHIDSWHAGTGATDNSAGVAAAMEAVRILEALKLHPRRSVRIGLWSGEEQGLFGSAAYVSQHFGFFTNVLNPVVLGSAPDQPGSRGTTGASLGSPSSRRKLVRRPEYDDFCAYFNLDNGGGKIRGVYLQGNDAARPLFRRWLDPLSDLGAETLTLSNTSGTDHLSFDAIGLPAFQFIQDPMDYNSRTHHSNADVYDRIQPNDLKQAATILAAFVYNAAMADEKVPHKPLP